MRYTSKNIEGVEFRIPHWRDKVWKFKDHINYGGGTPPDIRLINVDDESDTVRYSRSHVLRSLNNGKFLLHNKIPTYELY